jgi:NADPH:quinone reductase-like Zn-dependent oxidoreductase
MEARRQMGAWRETQMRAVRQTGYGDPAEVLRVVQVEVPEPGDDQVLVRVRASSVNSGDWRVVYAKPFIVRLLSGVRRPRDPSLGGDLAGVVEAVGGNVEHLSVGDEVYGVRSGAFAEYVATKHVVRKPANLTFEEAAAVPIAALTALQALRDKGGLQPGQHVLINGAGGGVGSYAVQVAKAMGAKVTATTRTDKLELLRSLGADEVIDYTRDDVTQRPERFDLIIDCGGRPSLRALLRTLRPGGMFVQVGAAKGPLGIVGRMAALLLRALLLRQRVLFFVSKVSTDDFDTIRGWVESGQLRPVIERSYTLDEIAEAIRYAATEQVTGKVGIRID